MPKTQFCGYICGIMTTYQQILIILDNFEIIFIGANFCSSHEIEKCKKCNCELDNIHLFKCTRKNENNINYNHILNGTVLEQRNAINYIIENKIEE